MLGLQAARQLPPVWPAGKAFEFALKVGECKIVSALASGRSSASVSASRRLGGHWRAILISEMQIRATGEPHGNMIGLSHN